MLLNTGIYIQLRLCMLRVVASTLFDVLRFKVNIVYLTGFSATYVCMWVYAFSLSNDTFCLFVKCQIACCLLL